MEHQLPVSFSFACPSCHSPLVTTSPTSLCCPQEGTVFTCQDGVWRFLLPARQIDLARCMQDYSQIRQMEGRGSSASEYYRRLPFQDLSGRFRSDWMIRARSYTTFLSRQLKPLERHAMHPLKILDLGAGNGWLSYRLAQRGHTVAALDLQIDSLDGLGAFIHYDAAFLPVQAEFDRLPFRSSQADVAIFNASLHYSENYLRTVTEALRVLKPAGTLIILDTPIYREPESGIQMVHERKEAFSQRYGNPSDALASEGYLTFNRLQELGSALGLRWQVVTPFYGLAWLLRPVKARLLQRREPARFAVLSARRPGGDG